ncbi:MAG: hypothetical protein Q4B56_08315, partial [Erysipelotrichaceae bacterium]|nr:hypothetical protein [Erysipelotrichaceae bacterium]
FKLPIVPGGTNVVYLNDLIIENYLDSLLDYHKNSYDKKSYVQVIKLGENLYAYEVELKKETSNESVPDDNGNGNIRIDNYRKAKETETNKLSYDMDDNKEIKTYYTNETVKIDLEISDDDGIKAYLYIIKNGSITIYESSYITVQKQEVEDTLVLDPNEYKDGTYQIEVVAYDGKDHKMVKKSDKIMIDTVAPTCKVSRNPDVKWTNAAKSVITGKCSDTKGKNNGNSGCTQDEPEKIYTEEGIYNEVSPGTVSDKAGNKTECGITYVRIDRTAPTCKVTGESTDWTYENRILTFNCTDKASGCKIASVTKEFKETAKTVSLKDENAVIIEDKAGNTRACKSEYNTNSNGNPSSIFNIYVDKDKPTAPTITGGSDNWKNYAQLIWVTTKSTAPSGIKKYQFCKKITSTENCEWQDLFINKTNVTVDGLDIAYYHSHYSGLIESFQGNVKKLNQHYIDYGKSEGREISNENWLRTAQSFGGEQAYKVYFRAVSNVGLVGTPSAAQKLKIDRTKPSVPDLSNSSGGALTCGNVNISANSTDAVSGVKTIQYSYNEKNWYDDWNSTNLSATPPQVFGTWSAPRYNVVYIRSCDNAGNCSKSSSTPVHIGVNSASPVCGTEDITGTCYEYKVITPTCPSGWTTADYNKCGLNDATGNICCKHAYSCVTGSQNKTCCHD